MPRFSSPSSSLYTRAWALGGVFETEIIDERPGLLVFRASGDRAVAAYQHEAGGHKWQQVPSNSDRVQSSTITVAILREPDEAELVIRESDLSYQATRGSGAGGQNRNKVSSAIILTYLPTGLMVRCETERDQGKNKRLALGILRAKLLEAKENSEHANRNEARKSQLGVGERGCKRRTIAVQRDQVVDHVLGVQTSFRKYEKGKFDRIW